MLRIVARHADGWNVPFLAPEVLAARAATLDRWASAANRVPSRARSTSGSPSLATRPASAGARPI
jgi:alkanesulfonate monooxygenase SsuD/methylene tetrahydromethanopterin reductase-like flavin-dependent oxidoreductase (luciferase family)